MLTNKENIKNLQIIINFFSREDEDGYVFAYTTKSNLISFINKEIVKHFEYNKEDIAVLFLKTDNTISITKAIEVKLKNKEYKALIIANLYEYISDENVGEKNLTEINFSRELFYKFKIPILFWLTEETFPLISNKAPDLYSQSRLLSFAFEYEDFATQANPKNLDKTTFANQRSLELLESQFLKARLNNIDNKRIANDYLLPYLEELSKSFDKKKVLKLYKTNKKYIDESQYKNLKSLALIFTNIQEYKIAISFSSKNIAYIKEHNYSTFELALALGLRALNLTKIGKLKNALEDYNRQLDIFEELYEANKNNVSFKNGLAISYEKLGQTHSSLGNLELALKYFEKRSKLGKELYEANKNNVSFKNGWLFLILN